jgi:thiosulfate dehydrogenase [quinone] large subunit
MSRNQKLALFLLRIAMGWFMFYAGITKVLNPEWSAEGYLKAAKTFQGFYSWFASPGILPITNFVNAWGLTLLGVSLILGAAVRLSSILGAVLMILYYFPVLTFPYIKPFAFIVDEHIIYALVLIYFALIRAGRIYGLDDWILELPICKKFPKVRDFLG